MKYYTYWDLPDADGQVQVVMSIRQIVKFCVELLEQSGDHYSSAEEAVHDWIAVNWACECDSTGQLRNQKSEIGKMGE